MKSVMHEASSIAKAIEQAWVKAGQPQEFSVKILEEPQKNFLGFTTRSAKVALFFDHGGVAQGVPRASSISPSRDQGRESQRDSYRDSHRDANKDHFKREPRESSSANTRQKRVPAQSQSPSQTAQPSQHSYEQPGAKTVSPASLNTHSNSSNRHEKPTVSVVESELPVAKVNPKKEIKLLWSDTTTRYTQDWLQSTLESMDCTHIHIAISASTPIMHITMKCKAPEYLHMESAKERKILASISHLLMDALRQKFKTGFKQHKIVITPEGESVFIL